jgi:hypothetical protein
MAIRRPAKAMGLPAPRPKLRRYKYIADEEPSLPAIVFDIIDGLAIQDVDPELYQPLLPLLRDRERALKEWRNQPASRSIEAAIDHITKYRYADDPNQLQPKFVRSLRPSGNKLSPVELGITVNMALRGEFDDIDPRHYRAIIRELQRVKSEALSEGDYLLAEKAVTASRRVLALTSENRFRNITSSRVESLAMQLEGKTTDRDDLVERSAADVARAEHRRDADLRRMERENDRELREFDRQFETEPPPELRKFSPTLLQLRTRERYMVQSGRYAEATEVRAEAERLERREIEEHRQRWVQQLHLQRQELVKKQQEKMYVRRVNADNQIAQMKRAAGAAVDHQNKAVQHAQHHYHSARVVQSFGRDGHATARETRLPKLIVQTADPAAVEFRQRAMINTIVYSRVSPGSAKR